MAAIALATNSKTQSIEKTVELEGTHNILFDRFVDIDKVLPWNQKFYLKPGTNNLVFPALNLSSFLTATNSESAPKRLRDVRKYKRICGACKSFVTISSLDNDIYIPFLKDGKPITVGTFDKEHDAESGVFRHFSVARLPGGIPNPKERPCLPLPWSLRFKLTIHPNDEIDEQEIYNLFTEGGRCIGIGSWRGVFGKFEVKEWS